jgi:hypothetical protein
VFIGTRYAAQYATKEWLREKADSEWARPPQVRCALISLGSFFVTGVECDTGRLTLGKCRPAVDPAPSAA